MTIGTTCYDQLRLTRSYDGIGSLTTAFEESAFLAANEGAATTLTAGTCWLRLATTRKNLRQEWSTYEDSRWWLSRSEQCKLRSIGCDLLRLVTSDLTFGKDSKGKHHIAATREVENVTIQCDATRTGTDIVVCVVTRRTCRVGCH